MSPPVSAAWLYRPCECIRSTGDTCQFRSAQCEHVDFKSSTPSLLAGRQSKSMQTHGRQAPERLSGQVVRARATAIQNTPLIGHHMTTHTPLQMPLPALTSACWNHTCSRSGTTLPMPSLGASPSGRTAIEESGGPPACASQGSPTDGRPLCRAAPVERAALTRAAIKCAPATVWPRRTLSWQLSGTARPMEPGRQRQCQPAATSEWLGNAASAGTVGPPC